MEDIIIGKMYNIPAISNGINTNDATYFFIPIHKTRRHVHGVPKEFLEHYIINMIETAIWEKRFPSYYYDFKHINYCAKYICPEKYSCETISNSKQKIKKEINCTIELSVYAKIKELEKYLNSSQIEKIKKVFYKKKIDNFRANFPAKSRYITYCLGNCINSIGFIHNGIPNGKQKCMFNHQSIQDLEPCKMSYCRECGVTPFHENELCKFINDIEFEHPELYRKCPGCGIWVEKEVGCDHMQCLCGVHFCYNCRGVLNAHDPYFHVCRMGNTDPHFRDFLLDHEVAYYPGEVTCNCLNCN
jgi:hypothetical protein